MKQVFIREIWRESKKFKSRYITMDNNYLFEVYSIYAGENIDRITKNIIKVLLPNNINKAKKILMNGFNFEGEKYVSFLTTVGAMKHEDMDLEVKGDYFFINEKDKAFIKELENVASLGKLKTLEGKEICINKDIVSRLSLLLSSGEFVYFDKPLRVAVLPEMVFKFTNNYLQFAEKSNGKIDLLNMRLEKHENLEVEHIAMDGSGLMMPSVADEITRQLDKGYRIDWIGFRMLGNASKGLLVRFDFKEYLNKEYGLKQLIVMDMWGNDVDLFDVDIVVNESLVKWGKLFNSYAEMEQLKISYSKYEKLYNSLCITKFNKYEPTEYSLTNYQILSNLALTPKVLEKISLEDKNIYERVINKDIDATRIMLGDWAREGKDIELSATTKTHQALQLDEKLINIQTVKYLTDSMLNKKVHELAGGRLHIKGNYKVIIKDVFSYFDSLIAGVILNGKYVGVISRNGLKANTNFVAGEIGTRVLARCPLNSATEIIKTTLVENEMYNKYFKDFSKDIIFYAFDDTMMLQSGADEDTDISLVIDNEDFYEAVIEDIDEECKRWFFRNQFDGKADKRVYNKENMYDCILETSGNEIGRWSNVGAKISNRIQELPYKNLTKNKLKSFSELCESRNKSKDEESVSDMLRRQIDEGIVVEYTKISEEEIKKFIIDNFQKYKIYSYYTLYLQMVAIDQVKTCISLTKVEKDIVKRFSKMKKPIYIYHAKYKEENKLVNYKDVRWSNSLMNNYASKINLELGYKAREKMDKEYNNNALFTVMKKNNEAIASNELISSLKDIVAFYNVRRRNLKKDIDALYKEKEATLDLDELERINLKIENAKRIREDKLIELEFEINDMIKNKILGKYDSNTILDALYEIRTDDGNKVKTKFIWDFFFEEFKDHLIKNCNGLGTIYELNENGDIKYLYKNYSKKYVSVADINLSEKEIIKKKTKIGQVLKIRVINIKFTDLMSDKINVADKKVYINNKFLGELFYDSVIADGEYIVESYDYKDKKSMSIYLENVERI